MQNQFDPRTGRVDPAIAVGVPTVARDAGLRSYMLKVYNYMASGVLLTGIVALLESLNKSGIGFKDLHTTQTSLEDIFVSLVREES